MKNCDESVKIIEEENLKIENYVNKIIEREKITLKFNQERIY